MRRKREPLRDPAYEKTVVLDVACDAQGEAGPPPYTNNAIDTALDACCKIAFGVARFDYQITGEHALVLARVDAMAEGAAHEHAYFPRRPMLLPKLLQALKDEASAKTLVRLVLEDPALAGNVLKRANSAFYRAAAGPVESVDRALVTLGAEGLRSVMAVAILQPVFRLPQGYFDQFAPFTWEQARRAAAAAAAYAKSTSSADPFVAQLLGLLSALARIVVFRLTMDMYRERPNLLPRAEVFIRSMQKHGATIARQIAATWELTDVTLAALSEQAYRISPEKMSSLGQAVYFGDLCGALASLCARDAYSTDGAEALLLRQGLPHYAAQAMLRAASSDEDA